MGVHLIVDSCCDTTEEMRQSWGADIVPLKVTIGDTTYVDDTTVDVPAMLQVMAAGKSGATSACPAPEEYAACMRQYDESMVVTLSSKLSGSYNAACVARDLVHEEFPDKKIHVFDSESASAGEIQLALEILRLDAEGRTFDEIVEKIDRKRAAMRTLFVLEDLGNFIKNGRIPKVIGMAAQVLSICPIMSDDGHGGIKALAKVRGIENSLKRLVDVVREMTDRAEERVLAVLTYTNCKERAIHLRQKLLQDCRMLRDVMLVPTGALSAMYANDGGVILAF